MDYYVLLLIPFGVGVAGLAFIGALYWLVSRQKPGTERMEEIASFIEQGADAFLKREFKTISAFVVVIAVVLLACLWPRWQVAFGFVYGSVCSLLAVLIGMKAAVKANVRAANLARSSAGRAFVLAFRGGGVMGLAIPSLNLVGISSMCLLPWFGFGPESLEAVDLLVGFGFGASLSALFAQLGGGIYTKAADVGADLVGKVELGIPEDDPRNPAVIADLVGDNVGDCAGRGADLFESNADNLICMMIVGVAFVSAMRALGWPISPEAAWLFVVFPLLGRSFDVMATLIGIMVARPLKSPIKALNISIVITSAVLAIGFYFLASYVGYIQLFFCAILGMASAIVLALAVQYYTGVGRKPVVETARAAEMGAAINIITGLSYGLESTAIPLLGVAAVLAASYFITLPIGGDIAGLYGIAATALGITSMTGIIQTADTFGPIVDNADGIAEMSGIKDEVGEALDELDAVGNITKAITKGYAMGCAIITSAIMLFAYLCTAARITGVELTSLTDLAVHLVVAEPTLITAAVVGAVTPFLFSALAIRAVGRGAYKMVEEVRRQFREIPGLLEGEARPDYARCVDISTKYALKEMVAPTLIGIVMPVAVGFILGPWALTAFLLSCTVTGAVLATFMFNTGATWDNAKKYIEYGHFGGKGTDTHKAAVIGDTVGDPLKDTAGPSLHILVKLVSIVSITLLPLFVAFALV